MILSASLLTVLRALALWTLLPVTLSLIHFQSSYRAAGKETHQTAFRLNNNVSLPHSNPTKSFWTHGDPDANPLAREGSEGTFPLDTDTVIIGSGITGVGAAYHLSKLLNATEMSHDIMILEARDFCSGATGRNGGHLAPYAVRGFRTNSEAYNVDEAVRWLSLENYTAESILSTLKSTGHENEVDLVNGGYIELFLDDEAEIAARSDWESAKKAGVDVRSVKFLSNVETQRAYGPPFPSVLLPGYNLWPLKVVTHFFRLAQKTAAVSNGASEIHLHTHTPVLSVKPLDPPYASGATVLPRRWILETPRGTVRAHNVIHATNAYAAHLLPFLGGPEGIVPTRGQVMAIRASVGTDKIATPSVGAHEGNEYWFPRPLKGSDEHKPLIILGGGVQVDEAGTVHESGITDDSVTNPVVSKRLRSLLASVYPDGWFDRDKHPEMEWTGIIGYTQSASPFVGPIIDPFHGALEGQYIAAGYTGHGMPRAFACAELVAQMVISALRNETWSLPDWFPEHFLTTSKWRVKSSSSWDNQPDGKRIVVRGF